MAVRARGIRPALITSAMKSRSLDADERQRRYLITMGVRVACFLSGCFTPVPWNWVLFLAAAVLPGVAVLLANAIDRRTVAVLDDREATDHPALTPGVVVRGDVDETEALR